MATESKTTPDVGPEMADALRLAKLPPKTLKEVADKQRYHRNGDVVTYVVNQNINFTNECVNYCRFCSFRKDEGYFMGIEEVLRKVETASNQGATEVCIQGGLHSDLNLDFYLKLIDSIKDRFPDIHLHAFSPMEVFYAARKSQVSVDEALRKLKWHGLDSMPGTAAEILDDRIRAKICPEKLSTAEWIEVITKAHKLGIPSTATMMYGHMETMKERIAHILLIRKIQEETGGFSEFVLLPFLHMNNPLGLSYQRKDGVDDEVTHALARLLLDGFIDNIQTSWVKLGRTRAQRLLDWGVNDLGGTLMGENISRSAGSTEKEYMSPQEIEEIIIEAGKVPRRRTTLYE